MTRYADPQRCPDCLSRITPGAPACPSCALPLTGQTAQRLYGALSLADQLLTALRASAPDPVPAGHTAPLPSAPRVPDRPRRRLATASVPQLLLGLGAACLLVAALVFLAVAWSALGVGGRTATLLVLTAVAGGLTGWLARRDLRGSAEALALVGYGLLTLDVLGADHAGWFGDLSTAGVLVLTGAALTLSGAAGALAVRRTAAGTLTVAEVVVATGAALMASGLGDAHWWPTSPSLLVATLAAALVTAGAWALGLRVAAIGSAAVTVTAWGYLTAEALVRVLEHATWRQLWAGREVWPLLVAAALVGAVALLGELPRAVRVTGAGVAELLVVVAVVAPALSAGSTTQALVGVAVLVLAGAGCVALPRRWGLTAVPTQVVVGLPLLADVVAQAAVAAERLLHAATPLWAGRLDDRLPALTGTDAPAPWTLPLLVLVLLATLATLADTSDAVDRVVAAAPALPTVVLTLLAGAAVGAVALYPVAVWLVVGLLLLVAVACTAWCLVGDSVAPLVPAGLFLAAGVATSLHAAALTEVALVVALAVTTVVHLRSRSAELSAAAGALVAATLAALVATTGHLSGLDPTWTALAGLLVLGAAALLAPYAPDGWWVSEEPARCRTGLEVGAAASALPVATAGVLLATADTAGWTAGYLTVAGVLVTLMSLLRADRRMLGWAGGALLALASWVRLWDLGVHAPEAYTLPSAVVLLVVGGLHLRRTPQAASMTALAPGLSLALVPSLLWVLADPTGPRSLLLGLGCLALVLLGLRLRLTAPLLIGAAVGAVLVLRLAAPYIGDAVPRWVLIGAAGALLVTVGATWEHRVAEARQLAGYVRHLR